jgi:hypothetical protein
VGTAVNFRPFHEVMVDLITNEGSVRAGIAGQETRRARVRTLGRRVLGSRYGRWLDVGIASFTKFIYLLLSTASLQNFLCASGMQRARQNGKRFCHAEDGYGSLTSNMRFRRC